MKTKLLFCSLLTFIFALQIDAQNRTIINATNSEISDNLDLKAVASIFGDSENLQDFERRLNDPNLQISNLDLNNDNQVDYLRVIESMENQTHVIIIQDVLARNTYQDVATIIVEKDNYNKVNVQIVGDSYLYGQNYIYQPVYYSTPSIFGAFWLSNYRPYYSAWNFNFYPSYFYAWNPFPVFRYRNNMRNSINSYNQYNYGDYRRSSVAISLYSNSRRSNSYEKQHPDYSFSRRNSDVNNRHELDQRRSERNGGSRNDGGFSPNKNDYQGGNTQSQGNYSQNRTENPRANTQSQGNYSQNRMDSPRVNTQQNTQPQRDYSQNRTDSPRVNTQQNTQHQRDYSQNRTDSPRVNTQPQRDYSQNGVNASRTSTQQSAQPQGNPSQNRVASLSPSTQQRTQNTQTTKENASSPRTENRRQ